MNERDFEPGIVTLLLGLPPFLATKAVAGREKVVHVFKTYFGNMHHEQGSS